MHKVSDSENRFLWSTTKGCTTNKNKT